MPHSFYSYFFHFLSFSSSTTLVELCLFYYVPVAVVEYSIPPEPTRQDSTATLTRENISGFGFSSPSLLQPCTKTFSGLPSRRSMTSSIREAGDAIRERPGIGYPLLPLAARPDTQVVIEAALPEAAALDRRAQPPTVLEIGETSLPQRVSSPR